MSTKKSLVSGFTWGFIGYFISTFGAFLTTIILARLLSPNTLGVYFIAFSIATIASVVANLGMNRVGHRFIAESCASNNMAQARAVIQKIILITSISTIIICLVLYFGGIDYLANTYFESPQLATVAGIVVVWTALISCRTIISELFRSLKNFNYATLFGDPPTRTIFVILLFLFWIFTLEPELKIIILIVIAANIIVVTLGAWFLYKSVTEMSSSGNFPLSKILPVASPFFIIALTNAMQNQFDVWIIGAFMAEEQVALYGAAARLALLVVAPLAIVNSTLPPIIAGLNQTNNKDHLQKILQVASTLTAIPSIALMLLYVVAGTHVLRLVYGDFYMQSELVLIVLAIGQSINVCTGSSGLSLAMTGHHNILLKINIISSIVTIMMGVYLVQIYGGVGMAFAVSATMVIKNIIMLFIVKKYLGIWAYANPFVLRLSYVKEIYSMLKNK